ncbi:MAG TPA: hypothetical protein VHK68_05190 [Gemmatimonadales bacterium]|jgi:hypothetical protein|nr:hypothetical protein [Gemmatimonadales bacterium]
MPRLTLLSLAFALLLAIPGESPHRSASRSFVPGRNGIWIGHQWYTGRNVQTGAPVSAAERRELIQRLRAHHILYVYLHVGPLLPDGSIRDQAGPELQALLQEAPDLVVFAWLGGGAYRLNLRDSGLRLAIVGTVDRLRHEGFQGVHLDIEPIRDWHSGYLALLRDLRHSFGREFLLSHATRRAGPFGFSRGPLRSWFWSEKFYREAMALTDQTVLMAYDTTLDSQALYTRFVQHETGLMMDWGCQVPGHEVLIGIPAFEDSPVSNPQVENIPNAVRGVWAALARSSSPPSCFAGVALYAEWVTSPAEWRQFEQARKNCHAFGPSCTQ